MMEVLEMIWQLDVYLDRANRGDKEAAYISAHILYQMGESDELVQTQLRRAAIAGLALASRELAGLAFAGHLVPAGYNNKNEENCHAQGKKWLELAASQNDIPSAALLSYCLSNGAMGFPKDPKAAMKYRSIVDVGSSNHDLLQDVVSILFWDAILKEPSKTGFFM